MSNDLPILEMDSLLGGRFCPTREVLQQVQNANWFCATKHVEVKDGYGSLVLVEAREKVKIDHKEEQ